MVGVKLGHHETPYYVSYKFTAIQAIPPLIVSLSVEMKSIDVVVYPVEHQMLGKLVDSCHEAADFE